MEYHDNVVHVLTSDEARILKGGLDFAFVRVDRVMTPIGRVYGYAPVGVLYLGAVHFLRHKPAEPVVIKETPTHCWNKGDTYFLL